MEVQDGARDKSQIEQVLKDKDALIREIEELRRLAERTQEELRKSSQRENFDASDLRLSRLPTAQRVEHGIPPNRKKLNG